jgi:hypothetical protein
MQHLKKSRSIPARTIDWPPFRLAHVRLGGSLIEVHTFRGPQVSEEDDANRKNGATSGAVWLKMRCV